MWEVGGSTFHFVEMIACLWYKNNQISPDQKSVNPSIQSYSGTSRLIDSSYEEEYKDKASIQR